MPPGFRTPNTDNQVSLQHHTATEMPTVSQHFRQTITVGPFSEKKRLLLHRGSLAAMVLLVIVADILYLSGSEYGKVAAIAAPMGLLMLLPATKFANRKGNAIATVILSVTAQWVFIVLFHHRGT
jgi:hypothetical protein